MTSTSVGYDVTGLSIQSLIDQRADRTPGSPFLVDPETGDVISYGEIQTKVRAVATNIAGQGVRPGESVAFAMTNGVEAALTVLGIFYGGYLATAVNLVAGNDVISYVLDHSDAKIVLSDEKSVSIVSEACVSLNQAPGIIVVDHAFLEAGDGPTPNGIGADHDGLLMYTSGTTGRPKGVVLTQANLLAGGANPVLAHELRDTDRGFCVLPLYHINGLCVTLLGPLVSGGSVIMPVKFSVSTFWETTLRYQATWLSLVPTQVSYLIHNAEEKPSGPGDLSAIRFARSASAPLSPDVQRSFEGKFNIPIIETMGLTETAAQILSNPLPPGMRKIGSPGVACGNEIMIASKDGSEMPRGEEGELRVRGANVMRLYRNNEKATAEAITSDGWLCTGDLGRMDEDGYIFITGRLKELIIKGGENIAPREIDEALYAHEDVIEAAAFSCPCPRYGETVEAGVMLCDGSNLNEEDLIELCVSKVGKFKAPDRVHILVELPKGPSGKIQRIKLAKLMSKEMT